VKSGVLRVWLWVLLTLVAQLVLLNCAPGFARTCDLLLLVLVALALARSLSVALSAALIAGLLLDSLSVHFWLLHTLAYGLLVAVLSLRRPYAYISNRSLLPGVVMMALTAKVLLAYSWTIVFVMPLSPFYVFFLSYPGIVVLLLLSFAFGPRLVRTLKEPEVLDFEVG